MVQPFDWDLCIIAIALALTHGFDNWVLKIICMMIGVSVFLLVKYVKEKIAKRKK